MASYVLVHGGFHAAWCWDAVAAALRGRGHFVDAIDMPGRGAHPTPASDASFADFTRTIGEALARAAEPAILVGHSLGGCAVTDAAAAHPERIRALVWVSALIPHAGPDWAHVNQELFGHVQRDPVRNVATLDLEAAADLFYHDCSAAQVREALARRCVEPRIDVRGARGLGPESAALARHYVVCEHDRIIAVERQRSMARAAGCRLHRLGTGHSPFFAAPDALAAILDEIAASSA